MLKAYSAFDWNAAHIKKIWNDMVYSLPDWICNWWISCFGFLKEKKYYASSSLKQQNLQSSPCKPDIILFLISPYIENWFLSSFLRTTQCFVIKIRISLHPSKWQWNTNGVIWDFFSSCMIIREIWLKYLASWCLLWKVECKHASEILRTFSKALDSSLK